jgi:hypothetical protein
MAGSACSWASCGMCGRCTASWEYDSEYQDDAIKIAERLFEEEDDAAAKKRQIAEMNDATVKRYVDGFLRTGTHR